MFLTLKEVKKEFEDFCKERNKDLCENVNLYNIIRKTKPIINRIMYKNNNVLFRGIGTLKKDVYKMIREYELEKDKT